MLGDRFIDVGFGGPNWWAFLVRMGVVCVRSRRRIWLRISPGSSRKRKGIGRVGVDGRLRVGYRRSNRAGDESIGASRIAEVIGSDMLAFGQC